MEQKKVHFSPKTEVHVNRLAKITVPLKTNYEQKVRQVIENLQEYVDSQDQLLDNEGNPFPVSNQKFAAAIARFKKNRPYPPLNPWQLVEILASDGETRARRANRPSSKIQLKEAYLPDNKN